MIEGAAASLMTDDSPRAAGIAHRGLAAVIDVAFACGLSLVIAVGVIVAFEPSERECERDGDDEHANTERRERTGGRVAVLRPLSGQLVYVEADALEEARREGYRAASQCAIERHEEHPAYIRARNTNTVCGILLAFLTVAGAWSYRDALGRGTSLGKRACGLRVHSSVLGGPANASVAIARGTQQLSLATLFLPLAWLLRWFSLTDSPDGRLSHDIKTRTTVVRRKGW